MNESLKGVVREGHQDERLVGLVQLLDLGNVQYVIADLHRVDEMSHSSGFRHRRTRRSPSSPRRLPTRHKGARACSPLAPYLAHQPACLAPTVCPPNTADQLRSGAPVRPAGGGTGRHLSSQYGCRPELRQLHPLVRWRPTATLLTRRDTSSPSAVLPSRWHDGGSDTDTTRWQGVFLPGHR